MVIKLSNYILSDRPGVILLPWRFIPSRAKIGRPAGSVLLDRYSGAQPMLQPLDQIQGFRNMNIDRAFIAEGSQRF